MEELSSVRMLVQRRNGRLLEADTANLLRSSTVDTSLTTTTKMATVTRATEGAMESLSHIKTRMRQHEEADRCRQVLEAGLSCVLVPLTVDAEVTILLGGGDQGMDLDPVVECHLEGGEAGEDDLVSIPLPNTVV